MSDDTIVGGESAAPAHVLTKKERREQRRALRRQEDERAEQEANEPEPEPVVCAWCAYPAIFDDETPEAEKAKCPACGTAYAWRPSVDEDHLLSDRQEMRDAVHRRIATALDSIFALLSEQWEDAKDAAEAARAGYR